ncbi:MAG: MBL fold metallo-hydrolase [Candidatus Saccharimonas sp.]
MFDIEYKGGNAVVFSSKKTTIAVDPCLSVLGLKDPKLNDVVELLTESRFRVDDPEVRIIIDGPGEYEVGDFTIRGVAVSRLIDDEKEEKASTAYRLEQGDVSIAVVGNTGPNFSEEQLESLGVVDILVIPVGGGGTLDATNAASLIRAIEPKMVIPVHYADAALRYEVPQDTLETFVKELGAPVEDVQKLKIKSAALPSALTVYSLVRS